VSAARGGPPTKAELAQKRTREWHKDEVSAEVNEKLKRGERADKKKIDGKVLRAATKPGSLVKRPNRRGLKRFPTVIKIPDELPDLPENLREFAFRYATEYRTNLDWAHIFHQSTFTIYTWIQNPDVAGYIMKIKQERRALMAERLNELEKKAFQKLNKILDFPVTEDSIEPLRKTIIDILTLKQGGGTTRKTDALINISQTQGQIQGQSQDQEMSLDQLQEKISELKQLEGE